MKNLLLAIFVLIVSFFKLIATIITDFLKRFHFFAGWKKEFPLCLICIHVFEKELNPDNVIIFGVHFLKFWINIYFE